MASLKMYFRLLGVYAGMDLQLLLRDTRVTLIYFFSDIAVSAANVAGMLLLAARFDGVGGFTLPELQFMMGWAVLASGVYALLFAGNNAGQPSRIIGRGQLDHMLVQPVPLRLNFITFGFAPFTGGGPLLCGLGLLVYSANRLALETNFTWWLAAAGLMVCSVAVMFAIIFLISATAFWAPYAAEEIAMYAQDFFSVLAVYPLGGLGGIAIAVFCVALPAGTVAWLPASLLLGKSPFSWAWAALIIAAGWMTVCLLVFKKGLKRYAKYSCPRYTGFGRS